MQWNKESLNKLVNEYNAKYFDNDIKSPIVIKFSRKMYNKDQTWGSAVFDKEEKKHTRAQDNEEYREKGIHIIRININLLNSDLDLMTSTLVHEMVHCLQDEIDPTWHKTYKKDGGHNKFFNDKCKELNNKFHFKYPLQRYVDDKAIEDIKTTNGFYYVYKIEYINSFMPKVAEGFFIKYLYDIEINMLKRRGWKIRFYKNVIQKSTGKPADLDNSTTIKYNWLKNIDPKDDQDMEDQAVVNNILDYLWKGIQFNFDEGEQIAESLETHEALNILKESGYNVY